MPSLVIVASLPVVHVVSGLICCFLDVLDRVNLYLYTVNNLESIMAGYLISNNSVLQIAIDICLEDDSDDEHLFDEVPQRRPRFIQERKNHFEDLDDVDFVRRFRLSKQSALKVLELIEASLEFPSDKNDSVAPINQLLLALRYYATGATQIAAADFSGVSEPTANRIIHRVSIAIALLYDQHIFFPRNNHEREKTMLGFYNIARFPRVLGAIDCTHIKICSPGGEEAERFRNRKNYFSLNCQAICNANLEFLDLVARWPGSAHDTTIFDHSVQRGYFEAERHGRDMLLVGDGGYPSRKYLMPPLQDPDPNIREEQLYNESQIRTRNPVERMFGVWKRRFPVLALGISVRLRNVPQIIVACAVLHNILRRDGDPEPPDDPALQLPMPWEELIARGQQNCVLNERERRRAITDPHRRSLIHTYFRSLAQNNGN